MQKYLTARFRKRFPAGTRRGAVAVLIAVSLFPMLAIAAVVLDGGVLFDQYHSIQATADAAAMAAAADLFANYQANIGLDPAGTAKASARSTAAANGFSNDGTISTVTVNVPPKSGVFSGQAGYAEVIINLNQRRGFSRVFGSDTIPLQARAVACGNPGDVGILILDPSIDDSLEIDGNLNIVNGGQITVNSIDTAGCVIANTATLVCGGLNIVGNVDNQGRVTYTNNGSLDTGIAAVPDPLANIPDPIPSGTDFGNVQCTDGTVLQPGCYGLITVKNNANVTLMPGIYFIGCSPSNGTPPVGPPAVKGKAPPSSEPAPGGHGIFVNPGGTLTGEGVMIYNNSGDQINFKQAGPISISPPSAGIYKGISFWQPRSDTQEIHIESSNNVTMNGTFYAQAGEFDFRPDGASTVFNMGNYICDQMEAGQGYNSNGKSDGQINLNPGTAAPTKRCHLVE